MEQAAVSGGGLYIIWLSDTHYYGGRTEDFAFRWKVHLNALQKGKHFNAHAQAVYDLHHRFEPTVLLFLQEERERVTAEGAWLEANVGREGCLNKSKSSLGVHKGYRHSEETRAKHRGRHLSPEAREKCRQAAQTPRPRYTPHPHTEDSKAKIAAATTRTWAEERASGVKRQTFSASHSEESREKMSRAKGGKPHPHRGTPKSEAQKAQQAAKMREWWARRRSESPETPE